MEKDWSFLVQQKHQLSKVVETNRVTEQYGQSCYGDLDYLEGTCLACFAEAIRAGYRGYLASEGRGEYGKFDGVQRWDRELYMEALRELF